jgi:copper(I)-binding protein
VSSSLRRGALAAAAIAFSIASLAACGAGNDAQTLEVKPDNAAVSVGPIKVQNALVITQPDPKDSGPAVVSATVFNGSDDPQTLDSITLDGGQAAALSAAKGKGKVTVPAHSSLVLGGQGNAAAVLDSGREAVRDGDAQKLTFTFSQTGAVSLKAYVVPAESYFSKWGPSSVPVTPGTGTASASASSSASAGGAAGSEPKKPKTSSSASSSASESAPAQ